jgi:DNA-binding CsgD family transcriptional regulator
MLDRLKEIDSSLGLYVFAKDKNLKYIYCNEVFSQGLGFLSPKEIIGKTDQELFDRPTAAAYQRGDLLVIQGGIFLNRQEVHPEVDRVTCLTVSKKILKNKSGNSIGVVGTALEISKATGLSDQDCFLFQRQGSRYVFKIDNRSEYLTAREFEVFKYLLNGATAKQIADALKLSYRTVEDYTARIIVKFNCERKYDLREKTICLGLLPS